MSEPLLRFVVYGLLGWGAEVLWTALAETTVRPMDWRLRGFSNLWMFPIYGACVFLFEPLHEVLRSRPWPLRAAVYVPAIWVAEYASSWLIEKLVRRPPWDYSSARWHLHGRIRWDYAPLWVLFGLLLERVHDSLVAAGPALLGR
ncbi:MAG: hypothetical protein HYZ53_02240 [Planctomycetes bacterium]|nr:hypothetical protein [Planctomycetota bacterium]